ncbi:ubiquitin-conjugating enzyme E2 G1 [Cryptococcus wingfieldii CBS 7118]|uniref:Ubiquitin-conjugating enzyme E2 G1 n=1 Tax=Cryptococcus wingfieldii CBS 7118 TaxID=1295528 RepID=A0A1E3JI14_9TREE|nr:ubiquitin-conjugating enzyme E2 G1 [Cryptococcus wingfieldii CBS 7118]ODO00520.1 ubiquitin-conjugating enzyme E2 G1 [Cryptococcus wingfieldii CBS 7118]
MPNNEALHNFYQGLLANRGTHIARAVSSSVCRVLHEDKKAIRRIDMQKHPVDGFSAGLVDDDNILAWGIVIMAPADTLWDGAILKARLIFPPEYPLLPPQMIFDSEMWHPNEKKGEEFVSILHAPGEDEWGYEHASERWLPVHTIESVLISVISLLGIDVPDLNSPANVDAAKEVREDYSAYKKRVKRLARRSAEVAYDD